MNSTRFAALLLMVFSGAVSAQALTDVQRDAAEQRRAQERTDQLREQQEKSPDVRVAAPAAPAQRLPQSESPCFRIHQIELRGADAGQFGWVIDSLSGPQKNDGPLRKCVGTQGIAILLQRAQQALIARGFVTTRVLAQPQDLSTGNLLLTVVSGRIRAIRFQTEPGADSSAATSIATAVPAKPGDILNLRDIEQALENFKRVPTAEADIQITPADQPDTSDLVISYQTKTPVRLSLSLDDSGSKSTGRYQGSATISWDNPLGLNDLFYVTVSNDAGGGDPGYRGNHGSTVHYSLPYGYWTLGTTVSQSNYHQAVAGLNQDYIYSGTSENTEIKLSRMVYRDASRKTSLSLKAWQRKSNNYIDDTEVQVQRRVVGGWELGLNHKDDKAILEGTNIESPDITFTKTDPSKAGEVILAGSKDATTTSHTEKTETNGLWQAAGGSGSTTETLNQTTLKGKVSFDNGLKITVQIPDTKGGMELKNQINTLAAQGGLSYLTDLANNPNVQWDKVALAHENWNYSHEGLTGAGAALVAIAIAVCSGGSATSLAVSMLGEGTAATAVAAGMVSLASQASVAMINNKGDIGKTMEELGSEQSVKNLLVSMVTAGAMENLSNSMSIDGMKLSSINAQSAGLGTNLAKNIINNLASATITSTLTGANLEDSLKTALVSAVISAGAGKTAKSIGDVTANDQVTKALAHALAGCVAGAAGSGSQGCSSGAIGAVVGELSAQWYDNPPGSKGPTDVLNFVKLMSAAAGAITGDGSAQSVNTAVLTGVNAAENNYLAHSEATVRAALKDKQAKGPLSAAEQQQLTNLEVLDIARDLALKDACQTQGDICNAARRDLNAAIGSYASAAGAYNPKLSAAGNQSVLAELNQNVAFSNDPKLAQQTLWDSFKEFAAPQAKGYATGAVLGKFISEAQAVYAAIKAEASVVPGALANGGVVADEIAALRRIGENTNGLALNGKVPNTVLNQQLVNELRAGQLPGNPIGGPSNPYTPREMPASPNPSATAEDFASRWFGGTLSPANAKPISNCPGCWSATNSDGVSVTYRPAGTASGRTADATASVDINFKPTENAINGGKPVKLKFPQGGEQ